MKTVELYSGLFKKEPVVKCPHCGVVVHKDQLLNTDLIDISEKLRVGSKVRCSLCCNPFLLKLKPGFSEPAMRGILGEVAKERIRQNEIHGVQDHTPAFWLSILGEEFGEVCREVCDRKTGGGDWANYRAELIQVSAVAVQMVEAYDRGNGYE